MTNVAAAKRGQCCAGLEATAAAAGRTPRGAENAVVPTAQGAALAAPGRGTAVPNRRKTGEATAATCIEGRQLRTPAPMAVTRCVRYCTPSAVGKRRKQFIATWAAAACAVDVACAASPSLRLLPGTLERGIGAAVGVADGQRRAVGAVQRAAAI